MGTEKVGSFAARGSEFRYFRTKISGQPMSHTEPADQRKGVRPSSPSKASKFYPEDNEQNSPLQIQRQLSPAPNMF